MAKTREGRTIRPNKDGTVSTEVTKTFGFDDGKGGKFYMNIPTLDEKGRDLTDDEAIDRVKKAGGRDPVTKRKLIRYADLETAKKRPSQEVRA